MGSEGSGMVSSSLSWIGAGRFAVTQGSSDVHTRSPSSHIMGLIISDPSVDMPLNRSLLYVTVQGSLLRGSQLLGRTTDRFTRGIISEVCTGKPSGTGSPP